MIVFNTLTLDYLVHYSITGTDDLPPLPPVESSAPPPPPPEPTEAPPPPPGEEIPTAVVTRISSPFTSGQPTVAVSITKSASFSRSVVDYSDLDTASASPPPPPTVPAALPHSTGTQLPTPLQVCMVQVFFVCAFLLSTLFHCCNTCICSVLGDGRYWTTLTLGSSD